MDIEIQFVGYNIVQDIIRNSESIRAVSPYLIDISDVFLKDMLSEILEYNNIIKFLNEFGIEICTSVCGLAYFEVIHRTFSYRYYLDEIGFEKHTNTTASAIKLITTLSRLCNKINISYHTLMETSSMLYFTKLHNFCNRPWPDNDIYFENRQQLLYHAINDIINTKVETIRIELNLNEIILGVKQFKDYK